MKVTDKVTDNRKLPSKSTHGAVAEEAAKLPEYEVTPSGAWRKRLTEAKKLTAERLCDIVYAMALQGATLELIARYYGVKPAHIQTVAQDVWRMGNAELVLRLFKDQIEGALTSKHPLAKIWAGKQFCGQRDDSPIFAEITPTGNGSGLNVTVTVAKATRDAQGNTIAEAPALEAATTDEPTDDAEAAPPLH